VHTSHLVKDTMGYLCTAALPHPLYCSDLAICDYFLFINVKNHLRCRIFESRYKLSIAITEVLKMVSHDGLSNFMGSMNAWKDSTTVSGQGVLLRKRLTKICE